MKGGETVGRAAMFNSFDENYKETHLDMWVHFIQIMSDVKGVFPDKDFDIDPEINLEEYNVEKGDKLLLKYSPKGITIYISDEFEAESEDDYDKLQHYDYMYKIVKDINNFFDELETAFEDEIEELQKVK